MFKKIFQLIIVFIFISTQVGYGAVRPPVSREWKNAFWNGGGTYPQIFADVEIPGRLYLISDVAGAWYSDDYADHWKWMNNGATSVINSSFTQSVKNPALMYILGTKYLEKSTDRGRNWKTAATFTGVKPFKQIAVDPNNSKIVYVAQKNGKISRSTDEAATFQDLFVPFGTNIYATFIYVDKTSTYLFAGSLNSGIVRYRISDGAVDVITLSGTNATHNYDFSTYTDLSGNEHICTGAGLKIACTADLGNNWTYTTDVTADTTFFISVLSSRQLSNGSINFLAHGRRLSTQYGTNVDVHSSDSGVTWQSHYDNVSQDTSIRGTYITFDVMGNVYNYLSDPFDQTKYYATTDGWVFRSDDSGANWNEKTIGAQNVVLSDVKVSPNGIWFVCGMDIGLSYSLDKGQTWVSAIPHPPLNDPQGFGISGHYWRIAFTGTKADWEAGNGVVMVTASMYINAPVYAPVIWRSTTNGNGNWTKIDAAFPTSQLTISTWSSTKTYSLGEYAATSDGVYIATGTSLNQNPANGASPGFWALTRSITSNHRALWGIGYPRAFACHPNGSACYLGIDGYNATEDGGLFVSKDQGATWTRMTQPAHWMVYNALSVDPTDPTGNTAVFADSFISGASPHFWKTTNGMDWVQGDVANYGIYDVAYNSRGNVFATGLYTAPEVYYSTNGDPGTWNYMKGLNNTDNIADGLYPDPDDPNVLYAGVNDGTSTGPGTGERIGGSVYMTTNALAFANATWIELTGDLPSPSGIGAIAVDKEAGEKGLLIVATENGLYTLELNDTIVTELEDIEIE